MSLITKSDEEPLLVMSDTKPLGMAPRCASTGGQPPHKPHRGAPTRELQNEAIDLGRGVLGRTDTVQVQFFK